MKNRIKQPFKQRPFRDFHEELRTIVETMDPAFEPEHSTMWVEHLLSMKGGAGASTALVAVDDKIDEMTAQNNKLQFEADSLALARDASQLAQLFQAESKSERSARMAKICHLRQENQIGSSLASQWMTNHCRHRAGAVADLQEELSKALSHLSMSFDIFRFGINKC